MFLIFSPVMIVIALFIVIDSGMPIIYPSLRIGRHGKEFTLYNFRTVSDALDRQQATRVGRFIRNLSLDHIPQLFNVIQGDMNVVGPRPMRPEQVDMSDPIYLEVLYVKPGMFSPAILQLGQTYNASEFDTKVTLEKAYLDDRSLSKDFDLIKRTVSALIQSRGNIKMRGKPLVSIDHGKNQAD